MISLKRQLPKIELHSHLDGSVRPSTAAEIAEEEGIELNCSDLRELTERMTAPPSCTSLVEYLERFELPLLLMQSRAALKRIAYETAEDAALENVRYLEVRFAPQLHTGRGLSIDEIVGAVAEGLSAAEAKYGHTVRIILVCMRHHAQADNEEVVRAASRLAGLGVVGVDLAGDEAGYPNELHEEVFGLANQLGLPITIHAGEAAGACSIRCAVEKLHARRIGHGVRLREDAELLQLMSEQRIPLEMCVISNVQTKAVPSMESHPIREYLDGGLAVTVNTDNPTVSATNQTREYENLARRFRFTERDFMKVAENGIEAAFADGELKGRLRAQFRQEWRELGLVGSGEAGESRA
ncbi:adenosine deaminase [Paenibacillus pasadenensis]|uniref:adenosine deaminase n=1 Tax=Paenibacillus pasadenensis TaxID=217090 RepID=UPI002041CA21|nr:adenosine deaminase [Paenibacillus pasadenensis]MCM3746668.1 adenosine deaminase [Paenibacillus pasadenensis]